MNVRIQTMRCDTIDLSKERQQAVKQQNLKDSFQQNTIIQKRQDTQTTPPREFKLKINSLNNSAIKSWKTPNASPPLKKRQCSNENCQNKSAQSQEKLEERRKTKSPDESKIEPHARINTEQPHLKRDDQKYLLRNLDKPQDIKHKELISRVQKNVQTAQQIQQSEHNKLVGSSNNPLISNYSPTADISKKGNQKLVKLEKQVYSLNWTISTVSNSPTNYAKNVFMYENQKDNLRKIKNNSQLYSPNVNESFEDKIKTIKKPSTCKGRNRNFSVDTNIFSKNNINSANCNNSQLEQGQAVLSEQKQVKNIRLKKQKINTKEDLSQTVKIQREGVQDNTGTTIFNCASKFYTNGNKTVSFSPKTKNNVVNEELKEMIENKVVYKEKESLNLTNININGQDNQKIRIKDILLPEDQQDKKK